MCGTAQAKPARVSSSRATWRPGRADPQALRTATPCRYPGAGKHYGDRLHGDRSTRRQRLEQVIEHTLANNGTVLIPAFSVSRTQELLYELEGIIHSKKAGHHRRSRVPVGAGHPRENLEATPNDQIEPDWPRLPIILD